MFSHTQTEPKYWQETPLLQPHACPDDPGGNHKAIYFTAFKAGFSFPCQAAFALCRSSSSEGSEASHYQVSLQGGETDCPAMLRKAHLSWSVFMCGLGRYVSGLGFMTGGDVISLDRVGT